MTKIAKNPYLSNWLTVLRCAKTSAAAIRHWLQVEPEMAVLPPWLGPVSCEVKRLVESDLAWSEQIDQHIITINDLSYPKLLRQIHNPPTVLFVKGDYNAIVKPQIAIVGSRNPTASGTSLAYEFARQLASANFVITSGLALGIDGAGHEGALAAKQATVAVLGHGLDQIYPRQHAKLAGSIVAVGGALVSEFPLGVGVKPGHFPQRNRIISGLSLGTMVIEAAAKSGSLITAKHAADQGREVFALPGTLLNTKARGCNALIQQGAKLVMSPNDVVEELRTLLDFVFGDNTNELVASDSASFLRLRDRHVPWILGVDLHQDQDRNREQDLAQEQQILSQVSHAPTTVDQIVAGSGCTPDLVNGVLLQLELQNRISSVPGGYCLK